MATIKQVSELASVSLATVSRVINNTAQVKPHTRIRVEEAMKKLGYRPNFIAQSLASNKSNTVGYVVPELHGSFFGAMLSESETILRKASKHLIISAGHSNEQDEINAIEALRGRRCDALILHLEAITDEYLIELAQSDIPFIVVNRYIKNIPDHCIGIDNVKGGYLATQSLIKSGHKNIAHIAGPMIKADAVDRLEGHKQALSDANIPINQDWILKGDFQAQSGYQCMTQLLNETRDITAVFCANDEMAYGACNAIREMGLSIPDDISVVGFDNIEFSEFTYPRLSTVHYPTRELGEMAANWVLNTVYKQNGNSPLGVITPHLVERDSISSI